MDAIFREIEAERILQTKKIPEGFDETNSKNDWIAYISAYAGRAADKVFRNEREGQTFRENLIKVGALVVTAIDAHDRGFC